MSSQNSTLKDLADSLGCPIAGDSGDLNQEFYTKCEEEIVEKVRSAINKEDQKQEALVGGLSGTGGLVCGLGLFPCICKLIAKLRG